MNIRSNRIMEEQKKELNLVEILKDCPKGTKLYSPVFGEIKLIEIIKEDSEYPIRCKGYTKFTAQGRYTLNEDAECVLFPSKDNRDWSTFKVEKPKWNPDTLQPFDKVLVRDSDQEPWKCDFFVSMNWAHGEIYPYIVVAGFFKKIVPYNDDTKHLIATRGEAPEYYRV